MSIANASSNSRSISIHSENDASRNFVLRLAEQLDLRPLASGSDQVFGDVVLIDVRDIVDANVVERVAGIVARSASREVVLLATLANLDAAIAACPDADVIIGDDTTELRLALASAAARARGVPGAVNDVTSDEGLRLQHLADEIARIARTLIELPHGLAAIDAVSDGASDYRAGDTNDAITAADVRRIIRLRRLRDRFFSPELFADPAWDMLLDLSAARIERARVAVSSLCIAASVPPTTALRWIKAMTDRGLLRRVADAHDARRVFIDLSDDAAAAMDRYLRAARANGGLAI